jgi:uncharacterized protein YbaP (TraB family)
MKRVVVFVTLVAALGTACRTAHDTGSHLGTSGSDTTGALAGSSGSAAPASPGQPSSPPRADSTTRSTPEPKPEASAALLAHPLLWSAEKDGKTTYLLGTMHMGIDAETRLPPLVWAKLHDAKAFAMEADIDDPKIMSAMITPSTTSLKDQLGEVHWKKLEDALGPAMASALDHLPPMVAAAIVAIRGLPPTQPMDKALATRAKGEHKPVVYLESAMLQVEMLRKWMDIKALKILLEDPGKTEERAKLMLDAYVAGDERKILAISDGERADALAHGFTPAEYDEQMNEMLYHRNASWIAPIEQMHAAGGGFVAVGVLHLVGPRSVADLLGRKGYKVTRVAP